MIATHTSLRNRQESKWHIAWCYEQNVPELGIAEALSYTMFTGSMPYFIDACDSWRSMILSGDVLASEPFKIWAETEQSEPSMIDHQ